MEQTGDPFACAQGKLFAFVWHGERAKLRLKDLIVVKEVPAEKIPYFQYSYLEEITCILRGKNLRLGLSNLEDF